MPVLYQNTGEKVMRRGKFFRRIFRLLIYIILIVVMISGIWIYAQSRVAHREQVIKDKENSLSQMQKRFDSNIYIIKRNIERYCGEAGVKNYVRDVSTYNRLVAADLLNQYFSSFGSIGINVAGFYPQDTYVLQDKLVYDRGTWLSEHGFEKFMHETKEDDSGYSAYEIIKNDEGITVFWNPQSMTEMMFSITFTNEYLQQEPQAEQVSAIIRGKNSDIPLFGEYASEIPPAPKETNRCKKGAYYYLYDNSEEFANMLYIYVVREPLFTVLDIVMIIGIIILLLLLSTLFSYLSAAFIYRPFGDTLKLLGKDDAVFDELDYLVCSSEDMKFDNQRLQKKLEENRLVLKDKRLGEFIMGMVSPDDMQDMVREYHMEAFVENGCCAAIINIDEFDNDRDLSAGEEAEKFLNILIYLKGITGQDERAEVLGQDVGRIVFLFAANNIGRIKKEINRIILDISDKFNVLSMGAVGNYTRNFYDVCNSYREAVRLFESVAYTFYNKNVIAVGDAESMNEKSGYSFPMETERQLIRCISEGNYDKAMQLLKTVLDANLEERNLHEPERVEFRFVFAATVKRVLQCVGKTAEEVFGEGSIIYLELSMCKSNVALYEKIWEMFERIIDVLKYENVKGDEELIVKITKFIKSNYQRDLSLQEMADIFNISTFYISRLFRMKKGITFKEYINTLRIEKAKQILLDDPDITVIELAKQVGYNRSETFYRVFKSIEGDTPKGYLSRVNAEQK